MTEQISNIFGVEPGRWLYGLIGIWIAQVLSFTPISFLVLIGVVEGVSPSMEEASQTLRADRWRTFRRVSLPLMAPGLPMHSSSHSSKAWQILAIRWYSGQQWRTFDRNILRRGGRAERSIPRGGSRHRATLLYIDRISYPARLALGQEFRDGDRQGDSGMHAGLPRGLKIGVYALVIPWMIFTVVVYAMILIGGFVRQWGSTIH